MATYPMRFGRFPHCFGKSKARLKEKECRSRFYVPIMYCYKCEANTRRGHLRLLREESFGKRGLAKIVQLCTPQGGLFFLLSFLGGFFFLKKKSTLSIVYEAEG